MFTCIVFKALFVSLVASQSAIIGYDCSDTAANYTVLDLTQVAPCKPPHPSPTQVPVQIQVVQTRMYRSVHVYTCLVRLTRIIHRCGMHSHLIAVPLGYASRIITLGRERCMALHRDHSLQYGRVLFSDLTGNTTHERPVLLAGTINSDGTCYGGTYSDTMGTWQTVVVQGQLTIDMYDYTGTAVLREESLIIPRTGVTCPVNPGYCLDAQQGEAAWVFRDEQYCVGTEIDTLYEGPGIVVGQQPDQVIVVKTPPRIFAFRLLGGTSLCGRSVHTTEHGMVYVSIKRGLISDWPKPSAIYTKNVDLVMHTGSKFLYVTQMIEMNIKSLITNFVAQECGTRRLALENRMILASLAPDKVSLLTDGTGVYGRVLGEVMYVVKCVPVSVTLRYTPLCFQELPVTYNNRSVFLTPVTRLLVPTGQEVPCKSVLHPQFRINGKWYIRTPDLIPVSPPKSLDPNYEIIWEYTPLLEVGTGGLYSLEQLRTLQDEMMFPSIREAVSSGMARRVTMSSDGKIDPTRIFSQLDLDKLTNSIAGRISWFFSLFGHYASIVFGVYVFGRLILWVINTVMNCMILRHHGVHPAQWCAGVFDALTRILTVHVGMFTKRLSGAEQEEHELHPPTIDNPVFQPSAPPPEVIPPVTYRDLSRLVHPSRS
nr:MAG: M protein [Salarius guttatus piscichuvirus]